MTSLKAVLRKADLARFKRKMKKFDEDLRKEVTKKLFIAGTAIANDAKKRIMMPPKTGHKYGKHQASAPGESPATDLGNLVRSIAVVADTSKTTVVVKVGADYGAALEFGTSRMRERPYLRPAVEANKHLIPPGIKDAFNVAKPKKG